MCDKNPNTTQAVNADYVTRRPSILNELKEKQTKLLQELRIIDESINILESNTMIQVMVESLRAMRRILR